MNPIDVFIESGRKKVFASALEWPGWSRSGRDEKSALQNLVDYGLRYAQVMAVGEVEFQAPADTADLNVVEQHAGNSSTDFGSPAVIPDVDREPFDRRQLEFSQSILEACWKSFDGAVESAKGRSLRKGPRGGGRDLDKMIQHVLDADKAYLSRLAWKFTKIDAQDRYEQLQRTREAIINALEAAAMGDLPEKGPRGGIVWPASYFIRRTAWHVLDHTWEIEDRIE